MQHHHRCGEVITSFSTRYLACRFFG
uniref:Uncharacterized protein n=1 Tax=Rhizophora mucronata TaxID=61149 RepID=A0A2P2J373_RHIMU